MRIFGVCQLCFSYPLGYVCLLSLDRTLPLSRYDTLEFFIVSLIIVSMTAGVGLIFRRDVCVPVAAIADVAYLSGCLLGLGISLYDCSTPLPISRHNNDDAPETAVLMRSVALAGSVLGVLASVMLLWMASAILIRWFRGSGSSAIRS